MASRQRPRTRSVTKVEVAADEQMECESLPAGDESNMSVDSPATAPPESVDASASGKTIDSVAVEGTTASSKPSATDPAGLAGTGEYFPSEGVEGSDSTRPDPRDPAVGLSKTGELVPSGSAENPGTSQPASLPVTGEPVQAAEPMDSTSPRSDLKDMGSPGRTSGSEPEVQSPEGAKKTKSLGKRIKQKAAGLAGRIKQAVTPSSSSPRKRDGASSDECVSPKSKDKSKTPQKGKKSPGKLLSPQRDSLSPEGGETSGSKQKSPMREGHPSVVQRLFSKNKDKQGDQRAPRSQTFHGNPEESEGTQLTAVSSPPQESGNVKKSHSFLSYLRHSKSDTSAPKESSQDCLFAKEPKPKPDEMSDSTVSLTLSPLSERRESTLTAELDNLEDRPLEKEQGAATEAEPKSSSGGTGDSSGTASGEQSVIQPEMDTEEATEVGIPSEDPSTSQSTGSGTASGEPSVAQPAMDTEKSTQSGSTSDAPSVAQPAVGSEPGAAEHSDMETEESPASGVLSGEPSVTEAKDDRSLSDATPRRPTMASTVDGEAQPSPSKKPKTED